MTTQFTLTLNITGASLDDIDNALIAAAGERLKNRLTKPLDFKISTPTPPTNPTVEVVSPVAPATPADPQAKKPGRRPGGKLNKETMKYEYPDEQPTVERTITATQAIQDVEESVDSAVEEIRNEETKAKVEIPKLATAEEAVTALKMVNSKFNIDKAKSCLDHFKVARCSELDNSNRGAFVAYCNELCGV